MWWHTMNSNVSFYVLAKWWCNDDLQNDFLRSVKFGINFRTIIHSFYTFKYFIHWMIGEISRAFVETLATEIFTFLFWWKLYRQKSLRIIQPKYGVQNEGLGAVGVIMQHDERSNWVAFTMLKSWQLLSSCIAGLYMIISLILRKTFATFVFILYSYL